MLFQYSAGAFIYRKEKNSILYLVLQKQKGDAWDFGKNRYDLPKGHIEKGESSEQAALREVKEEIGADVSFIPGFSAVTKYFFYEKGKKILKQVRFFLAEIKDEKVKISEEHTGYEWVDYNDAIKKLKFKDLVKLMPFVRDYIEKCEKIKEANRRYANLPHKSKKWGLSRRHVPGEGKLDAQIMVIGQAPGRNEDEQKRPFIGRSGMLLDALFKKAKMARKDLYITSVVQFFPPGNRLPTKEEIELCKPLLFEQIRIIKPRYMVLLGNVASSAVLGIGNVEKNHGSIMEKEGIVHLITFHPAAALRFKKNEALMLSDIEKLKDVMKEAGK